MISEPTFEIIPAEVNAVSAELSAPSEKAMRLFKPFQASFTSAMELIEKESEATTAAQARELRLKMVKARTAFSKIKDESKGDIKLAGAIIDWYHNRGRDTLAAAESRLRHIEEEEERKEIARKAALKSDRTQLLAEFGVDGQFYQLGEMPEEGFTQLLEASRIAFETKKAAQEKAAEDAKIAAEKAETERIKREEEESAERARIKAEAERLAIENERLKIEHEKAAEAARAEFDRLEAERKEHEEKAKADAQLAADRAREDREAVEQAARIEREQIAKKQAIADEKSRIERFEAELVAKSKAEQLQKLADEERKKRELIEDENRARLAAAAERKKKEESAARKAASADKEKLRVLAEQIKAIQLPSLSTAAGKEAMPRISKAITSLIDQIRFEYAKL